MEWIPIFNILLDVFGSAPYAPSPGGAIYDMIQVLAGFKIISETGAWVARQTAWKADDVFWAKALHWTAKALTFCTDLASGNSRPKEKK